MTVQFSNGLTNLTIVVAPAGLERKDPVILPDRKNVLETAEKERWVGRI
jgi:hypothetical protein